MRDRDRGERGTLPRTGGTFDGDGNESRAEDRVRSGGGNRQGKREDREDGPRDLPGEKGVAAGRTGTRARPGRHDRAGRRRIRRRLTSPRGAPEKSKTVAKKIWASY